MKKLFAVIITVMLVFSLTACGGDKEGSEIKKGKFEAYVEEYLSDGKFSISYEMEGFDQPLDCAFSGENIYIHTQTQGYEIIIIKNADATFMLMPSMKTYMSLGDEEADNYSEAADDPFGSLDNLGEYTEGSMEIDAKSYDYEEYIQQDVASRYLFDGNDLVYIIADAGGENESIMKVISVSNDVDDSLFEIPEDYTEF